MLVTTLLAELVAGETVELHSGDTLRVEVSFKYTVAQGVTVTLWASLGLGLGRDIESFEEISLEATLTPKSWAGYIDLPIPASGKKNGTYWLQSEVKGYPETQVRVNDAAVISGMGGGITESLPSLMALMVMTMMMGMFGED